MNRDLAFLCSRVEKAGPNLAERVAAARTFSGKAARETQNFLQSLDPLDLVVLGNSGNRITEGFPETLIFLDEHNLMDLAEWALARLAEEGFIRFAAYRGTSPELLVWARVAKSSALNCARLVQAKLFPLKPGVRTGLSAEVLCEAAIRGNETMLRYLVEEVGVHPDGRESAAPGISAVQRLFSMGHEKLGLWLASRPGVNLLRTDTNGKDTLMYAAGQCSETVGRLLLDRGLRPQVSDGEGRTALHEAVLQGNLDMARVLLDAGANPNAPGVRGWTPLHAAAERLDMDMAELLVRYGADLEARNFQGNTPFLETAGSYRTGRMPEDRLEQAVSRWKALGADLKARNWNGRDAVLLSYGADSLGNLGRVLLSAGLRPPEKLFDGTSAIRAVQRSKAFVQDLAAANRREQARQGMLVGPDDGEPSPML
jgi:hypothetical protein